MSEVFSEVDNPLEESPIQRWALWGAVAVIGVAGLAYLCKFASYSISGDPEQWGQMGDYFGGIINPIVGFLTICLLTVSLRQNQIALKQTREELKETRNAIKKVSSSNS